MTSPCGWLEKRASHRPTLWSTQYRSAWKEQLSARYCASMSEENIKTVRRIYGELELGDFGAMVPFFDAEVVT